MEEKTCEIRRFEVPGEPKGKMRPKASFFGGHARVYTPSKQVEYENWVRLCYERAHPGAEPFDRPLMVILRISLPIPRSESKKRRALMLEGRLLPTKKPDIDNVMKSILDALNGLAYRDDALICAAAASKRYAESPGVWVELSPVNEGFE